MPAFEPGDYATISLQRPSSRVDDEAVQQALQRLRERAARFEPVEGRGVIDGDTVTLDLDGAKPAGTSGHAHRTSASRSAQRPIRRDSTSSCSGSKSGATKTFTIHYPADYTD